MVTVRERILSLERELAFVKRELADIKAKGSGMFPEWADLKTTVHFFRTYSVATLRYHIKAGIIPKSMVRKEGKKYEINLRLYKEQYH